MNPDTGHYFGTRANLSPLVEPVSNSKRLPIGAEGRYLTLVTALNSLNPDFQAELFHILKSESFQANRNMSGPISISLHLGM